MSKAIRATACALLMLGGNLAAERSAAQEAQEKPYHIASGDLNTALREFSAQSRVQLIYPSQLADGKKSVALSGSFTVDEALQRLLSNSGLQAKKVNEKTIIITPSAPESAPTLLPSGNNEQTELRAMEQVEEIVVTGMLYKERSTMSKMDVPLIEMAQSISVVMREQIDVQGSSSVRDIIRYTAGASVGRGQDHTSDYFYMRGFEISATLGGLYRDGMRQQFNLYEAVAEPYGMERVEVIKGPSSVLFGQSEPGGLVNYVTKRPTWTALREIAATFGRYDYRQVAADFGGPIDAQSTWSYRLTGLTREADSMIDYVPDERVYVAPALSWRPSDATSLTLLGVYQNNETVYNGGLPASGTMQANPNGRLPTQRFLGEPGFDDFDARTRQIGYVFDHRFSDSLRLSHRARYHRSSVDWAHVYVLGMQEDERTIDRGAFLRGDDADAITTDTQLIGSWSIGRFEHNYLAGFDYVRTSFDSWRRYGSAAPLDGFAPTYGSSVDIPEELTAQLSTTASQIGVYVQDQIKLDGKWVVMLAARNDWAESTDINRLSGNRAPQSNDAFTGRVGLLYLSSSGLAPYVSYSESFFPEIGLDYAGAALKPSTGKQYEVGVKYQPADAPWFVTLSAFDVRKQNVVGYDPFTFEAFQTGELRSQGVELESMLRLASGLNLTAALSYTDAEITRSVDIDLGRRPAGQPREMASLWADYAVQSGALKGFGFGGGVRYVGRSNNWPTLPDYYSVDSYTVADAMLRYDLANWRFALNASNITDEVYVASCFVNCFYGERLNVTGTATYRW